MIGARAACGLGPGCGYLYGGVLCMAEIAIYDSAMIVRYLAVGYTIPAANCIDVRRLLATLGPAPEESTLVGRRRYNVI